MKLDGVSAIALLTILSFGIDRIVGATMFVLTYREDAAAVGASKKPKSEKQLRLIYAGLASALAVLVLVLFPNVRMLNAFGIQADQLLDSFLTGIILVGGSDQLAGLLKTTGMPANKKPEPVRSPLEITGKIVLEDPEGKKTTSKAAA